MVLGENYDGGIVPIQQIAGQQGIPKRFLEQILNDLKAGGFVESRRGAAGGYRLARTPEDITLAALIRHVEGALVPAPVLAEGAARHRQGPDAVQLAIRSVLKEVREAILKVLDRATLADLCARARALQAEATTDMDYVI
jgi:Rrf2 family protein